MCNQRFEVATCFNTFGEIRVNVKFTHPNSQINSRVLAPLVLGAVLGMVDAFGAGPSLDDA